MAYISETNDPNAPQQQQPGVAGAAGSSMNQPPPQTAGGTSGPATSTSGGGGTPQGAGSVPTSTQAPPVQDLKAYLSANAPQAVQMGEHIAGDLGQQAGKVTGDINAAQTDLASQVAGQTVAPNSTLVGQAAANPADFVQNPQNLTDFFAQRDANYGGPANFEATPYSQSLTNEVSAAQQQAPDITQPYGVEQLARGQEKNPTNGMSNLDALLLQENPNAMAPIQNVIPQFANLSNQLGAAGTATNSAIQNAITQDAATKAGVQTAFNGPNGVVPGFTNDLNTRMGTARTGAQSAEDKLMSDFLNGGAGTPNPQLTPEDYKMIGASPAEMEAIFGGQQALLSDYGRSVNLRPTITEQSPDTIYSNPNTIATQGDYDKAAALEKLLGTGFNSPLDQTQAGNIGKTPPLVNFDIGGARGLTSEALRTADRALLDSINIPSGRSIDDIVKNGPPEAIAQVRNYLPANQRTAFDNAIQRLNLGPIAPPFRPPVSIPPGEGDPIYRFGPNTGDPNTPI